MGLKDCIGDEMSLEDITKMKLEIYKENVEDTNTCKNENKLLTKDDVYNNLNNKEKEIYREAQHLYNRLYNNCESRLLDNEQRRRDSLRANKLISPDNYSLDPAHYQYGEGAPAGHRVLVKLLPVEKFSKGGIALMDNTVDMERYGMEKAEVIQIGPQAFKIFADGTPWCKVGDIVDIAKYSGKQRDTEGDVYRCINDEDVQYVWTKKKIEELNR